MPYFKDTENKLHFLESEEYSYFLPQGSVEISEAEAQEIRQLANTLTPEEQQAALIKSYDSSLTLYFDSKAKEKNYDNRISCSVRAGYPGPFQAEGLAFATWMDTCNAICYQILADVQAGLRPIPTFEEVTLEFPTLIW